MRGIYKLDYEMIEVYSAVNGIVEINSEIVIDVIISF